MPSIPQSLLWISLVVLWLFVLVPMLISKRDAVRRTSDVALATRVLNTGRGARLRRRGPAAGHYSDPDWRPSADDLDDDFDGDDSATAPRKAVVLAAATVSEEPDYLDVDVVEMDSGALPVGSLTEPRPADPQLPLEFDPAAEAGPETQAIRTFADADFGDEPAAAAPDEAASDAVAPDEAAPEETVEETPIAETDDDVDDGTDHDYEYVDDSSGMEAPSENDVKLADSMSQARRHRYETKTSLAVRERKIAFRKRMLVAMGVALLVSAIAAFALAPSLWWACGAIGVVTVLYLGYLRRQTRIEEQLRRRRAKRVARSRLGVENTDDPQYDVVPSRLKRPGAVVLDIDDEDPIFEHLDYASLAGTYDLPRASGQ
ncbi:gephyrin-like molybdotransferase receptor GlpR [Mycolicibacterium sediminis]|uniref:Membrane protein n=1 Tax=Mycolicibacterium sediminis TaxID=1286180 RepID=A0A7I7QZH7_9MYCO|nr:gephyrin-like molybdotransferase receptor GlpR [Mycolicibacterium sediminis]BBY31712.1 membrane protein [Mycolicibacterium sediminis]